MANSRLILAAAALLLPAAAHATGAFDEEAPPSLPYYLDRLPAKPPSAIFRETFDGAVTAAKPTDFKAALLALAKSCEGGAPALALLATTEKLLAEARLVPIRPAPFCNLLNDIRDLFAAAPAVTGKTAAGYIRWRVENADAFNVQWDNAKLGYYDERDLEKKRETVGITVANHVSDPKAGPLAVHWLYLQAALNYGAVGGEDFQAVIDEYPDHPRAEAARFMLARAKLRQSREGNDTGEPRPDAEHAPKSRGEARDLFLDYQKRYPKGRFIADVPGWLGALSFDDGDHLKALEYYLQQADVPGHPEVLKSAGFMCERCLSELAFKNDEAALARVAEHPRLAMSLIYLLVNTDDAPGDDDPKDAPYAKVARWRRTLLPRLAAAVAEHKAAYTGGDWQARYLTILAQAASGAGEQDKALALCDMDKEALGKNDDLAFIRLVALQRAHRLPEAIAAGREFAKAFPSSLLAPGATLRLALALQDNHQAGAAFGELSRLKRALAAQSEAMNKSREDDVAASQSMEVVYPSEDGNLSPTRSVLRSDASGAELTQITQVIDALLNLAPLPELAAAIAESTVDSSAKIDLRAVLVQRWLAENENFAEAKKYATPAQWSIAAAGLEKLVAEAGAAPAGEPRAAAFLKVADAWTAAQGKLLFAPLETDKTRRDLYASDHERAGLIRRVNALALGTPADRVNHALSSRDEWQHAFDWQVKAADAAPAGSPTRARALWAALRAMPSMTLVSPYLFTRAGETEASGLSRKLCERLVKECPDSREAREFALYYDLAPPIEKPAAGEDAPATPPEPDLLGSMTGETIDYGEPEYIYDGAEDSDSSGAGTTIAEVREAVVALQDSPILHGPAKLATEVPALREKLRGAKLDRNDMFLVNFLDDLGDFLKEPKLPAAAVKRYVELRTEMLSVEHWGVDFGDGGLPPVPGATDGTLNETVLNHIRAAYKAPEMAPFKDYLDFLALAVIANSKFDVEIPGETETKDYGDSIKKEPVTYTSRDYPKLARLAEGFLKDHPKSRKRETVRLLYARALYAASRPHVRTKFAVWPQSGHFASGTIIATDRQQPFDPKKIGAALNGYDTEFPKGRYAGEIRNLRGLLGWRTQDWPIALDATLATLADESEPVLQGEAASRLNAIFVEGLQDETERQKCLAAIKARPAAVEKLRAYLPKSAYPLRMMQSWLAAQLGGA